MFSVLGLLVIVAMVLGACAAPAPEPPQVQTVVVEKTVEVQKVVQQTVEVQKVVQQTVEVPKEVQVTVAPKTQVVYNSYQSDPEPRKADAELVKQFMEKNPNIEVIQSTVAHEDFKQALRAYLTSSTPPDVMTWFAGNRARFFIDKGVIMDISDVYEKEGWNNSYPKGFKALSTVDGKQYFVPTSYYWWALYFNKVVLDKYGIQPPKTFDELLAACDTLNENGVIPIAIGAKAPWTLAGWFDYLNMRTNGPEFHINLMLGKEKYDDPRVKKTFENWKALLDHKCFMPDSSSYMWQEVVPQMLQGKAAMYLMGQFLMDSVPKENQKDFDFVRFPIIDPNMPIGEDAPTDGFFAAANAPHPEAAKALLGWFGSKEAQTYFAKTLNRLPTNTEVDTSIFPPEVQKGIELLKGADYIAQFYDRDTTPEMAEKGMAAFQEFTNDPTKIDQILAQLEKDRQQIFATEQQ
jgi:multiple sugar transport system substrate-binding protein/raffinose/stachyose/melibiose transport system substrate-binding protein